MKTGSLINEIYSLGTYRDVPIYVGMDATEVMYTDRHAGEIVWVSKNRRRVKWRPFKATQLHSGPTESQDWTFASQPEASSYLYSRRANGSWQRVGQKGGNYLALGIRDHYYDYSF